jgi:hypothetical protein
VTPTQIAGLVAAVIVAALGLWSSRTPAEQDTLDRCAADALRLAGRLRAAACPEGVAACQTLLNVILEHPGHTPPEVQS